MTARSRCPELISPVAPPAGAREVVAAVYRDRLRHRSHSLRSRDRKLPFVARCAFPLRRDAVEQAAPLEPAAPAEKWLTPASVQRLSQAQNRGAACVLSKQHVRRLCFCGAHPARTGDTQLNVPATSFWYCIFARQFSPRALPRCCSAIFHCALPTTPWQTVPRDHSQDRHLRSSRRHGPILWRVVCCLDAVNHRVCAFALRRQLFGHSPLRRLAPDSQNSCSR